MKIILTGSLGHISKPLAVELVQKGHSVTVTSSKAEKQKDIEAIGAKAAIGTMQDADFLTRTTIGVAFKSCHPDQREIQKQPKVCKSFDWQAFFFHKVKIHNKKPL